MKAYLKKILFLSYFIVYVYGGNRLTDKQGMLITLNVGNFGIKNTNIENDWNITIICYLFFYWKKINTKMTQNI